MFETFDYGKFEIENGKYKDPNRSSDIYVFGRGREVMASWTDIYEIPPFPYFYWSYKEFYEQPNQPNTIKEKGKYFGDVRLGSFGRIEIGHWYYFDEKGKLIKEVDEDKKFGKFSYNEVLKFLDSKKDINLNTGEGRDKFEVQYYYSDKSTKKLWKIFVKIGEPQDGPPPPGYKYEKGETISYSYQKGKYYYLDGDTGEQIKTTDKRLLDYKEIIPNFEEKFPKLIESAQIYKTHEGKAYTQAEWQAYEEKEYEAYCKRTGRPYTPKSQEPTAENQGDKSPFLAEDWEKGDDKTPRKKGFWDNLFG
ncbi:hypothetical protein [Chryseobacterium sp. FH2]|uniref:hypothetical protein n=1 Tax=Chryseobacterium sp. FH2 TaxID=1674291 RepID=UPI0010402DED|nr:hypothetical protein [Chryseobacterium sp. FH2]